VKRISSKKPTNICPICKRIKNDSQNKYCKNHNEAKKLLKQGYESWLKAYGSLSWDQFLKKLLDLEGLVGDFIKEIVEYEFYFHQ
jgi:hypothetical protein